MAIVPPDWVIQIREERARLANSVGKKGAAWSWPFVAPCNSNSTRRSEKAAASEKKRRNRKSSFSRIIEAQNGLCWFCNEEMGGDCTREHLLAKTLGGTDKVDNIRAAHGDCNGAAGHLPVATKHTLREIGHRLGRLAVIEAAHRLRRRDAEYAFRVRQPIEEREKEIQE